VPASELILSNRTFLAPGQQAVLVGFSRSGETTETVTALQRHHGRKIAVSCRTGGALSAAGDIAVELPAADDQSVVETSAFTTMLLAALLIAADLAGDADLRRELTRVPGKLEERLEDQQSMAEQLGGALAEHQSFIFLGLGPFYGLALEAMLKMKELTQVPCEAYSPLEFRHGPISMVNPGTLAVLIGSRRARDQETAVLADIQEFGGRTFNLAPGANELATAVLQMPFLQLLAYYRAVALGKDPEQPRHLSRVVTLNPDSL
jgi:glucosamine--fructose-6-phosphate aminotransferase (isomerizing)